MIYFIRAKISGSIKIGWSQKNPQERLKVLQTGCPFELEIIGLMPGTIQEEQTLHRRFEKYRLKGEWFEPALELMAFIIKEVVVVPFEFMMLAELQPKLLDLWRVAHNYRVKIQPGQSFCANRIWYGHFGLKEQLLPLVGDEYRLVYGGKDPLLINGYDLAYDTIYSALPDCCECGCLCLG